jgi:hypothetical protein
MVNGYGSIEYDRTGESNKAVADCPNRRAGGLGDVTPPVTRPPTDGREVSND